MMRPDAVGLGGAGVGSNQGGPTARMKQAHSTHGLLSARYLPATRPFLICDEDRWNELCLVCLFIVSKQSEHLREQARRAERLASTISDHEAGKALKAMSRQFDEDADRLEKPEQA